MKTATTVKLIGYIKPEILKEQRKVARKIRFSKPLTYKPFMILEGLKGK